MIAGTAVKKKDENNWIKDPEFLPKSLPSARIMIFGYNSHAVFNASEANVNEHAGSLLQAIWQKTRKVSISTKHKLRTSSQATQNASGRPLIFICHSLGGLLAKRVSTSLQDHLVNLLSSAVSHHGITP